MRTLTHVVGGDVCSIYFPERDEDMRAFEAWMAERAERVVAVDTETTGLGVFGAGFGVRLVQFGDEREAWVVQAAPFRAWVVEALRRHQAFVAHNFAYDAQVIERCLGVTIEEMTPKVFDTIIMSKLVEPHRARGHKLKPLSEDYVDPGALDTQDGLTDHFRRLGFTKETGWALIDIDDELYVRYAGLDVIYTARLFPVLVARVKAEAVQHLVEFETTIQGLLNVMRRKGLRVDLGYAAAQREVFLAESAQHLAVVRDEFGLGNLNSPAQVQEALLRSGAVLTERNPSGSFKTGKEVLLPLAGMDEYWEDVEGAEVNELAWHIARGKRAERFGNAYLGKFIDLADPDGYVHPSITGLEARTSRSAVSDPPLQQLPSKDWKVRRAILADEGSLIISADYAQIEFRVLAMLADVKRMKEAILQGLDLHGYTAELAYGPAYTKANRTHMKGAGFGVAYGGGATGLAKKMGISVSQATAVVQAYNRVYPEIKRWSAKLQREARASRMKMRSRTGRILTLDRDRVYAALNYQIQSMAADVLKNALEALWDAGLGPHLLMPVHDEIVAQAPEADAEEVAREVGRIMTEAGSSMFEGVEGGALPLDAEGEVYGPSWGHGYGDAESMGRWF